MANIKSKEKNMRRIAKATKRNSAIKSKVRTAIKKAKIAVENKEADAKAKISLAHKEINTAVSKGVFHKNNGARKSSRLDTYVTKHTA